MAEQPVKTLSEPNIICKVPGATDRVIILGAHFDHVNVGAGVVDNWSGASLLPSLLQTALKEPRHHTFIFIGFSGEERGEIGSAFYVGSLSEEQRSKISAMVNPDTLGLGPTEVWASRGDPKLVNALGVVAHQLASPLSIANVEQVGSTDSEQFRIKNVPAVTIHTLTSKTLSVLHTMRDQESEISWKDYYENYRLTAAYLVFLDSVLNAESQQQPAAGASVTQ